MGLRIVRAAFVVACLFTARESRDQVRNRQIARANWQLHEAIEDYGYDSPQANHWRHELHEAYERQEHLRRKFREEQWREHEWRERRDYYV